MTRFNKKIEKKVRNTRNLAGGKAFTMAPALELVHAVLTTFLEDKFYETGNQRLARIQELVQKVAETKDGPEFVAKLAVVARGEFNLRSVSHVLIGELAQIHRGDDLVKRAIIEIAERPDDLTEIASYVGLPLPKQVKRGIRNALLNFDSYSLAKYRGDGKELSLVDPFNLTHPKVQHANKEQKKAWADLMKGELKNTETWEAKISATKGDAGQKTEAWEDLVISGKLPYMALLRNLNNLIKSDVSVKAINAAVKKLTDPEAVLYSKQIPFRFLTAYNVVSGSRVLRDAVSDAMDIAVGNVQPFKGKTLIALDVSGSMKAVADKAGILAAVLIKANKDADVVVYNTRLERIEPSSRVPVVDMANGLLAKCEGGTNTDLVFDSSNKQYNRIVIISDNESWKGFGVQSAYLNYKRRTGADPYIYAIDIAGYGTTEIKGDRVCHLAGFSDKILDFIGAVEKGDTLVDYIKNYDF